MEEKTAKKEKSTVKKKKSYTYAMEERINTKLKEIDRIKLDLTEFMKRSRSTQKKHRKSHSIIRLLRWYFYDLSFFNLYYLLLI